MSKEQKQQEVYEVKENEGNDNGGKGIDLNLQIMDSMNIMDWKN